MSGHDGNTLFEEYLTFVSRRTGYVFVTAGGNESNAKHHTQGIIPRSGAYETINLRVGAPNVSFPLTIFGTAYDKLSVGVTSPTGETLSRVPFKAGLSYNEKLIFEKTTLSVSYYKDVNTIVALEFQDATQGIWEITLYGDSIISGEYYSWLPVTGQINENVEFLKPVPEYTIVFPATGVSSITCGAYSSFDDSLFVSSSWGPTRQPRMSPDLVAPGVGVRGVYPAGNGTMPVRLLNTVLFPTLGLPARATTRVSGPRRASGPDDSARTPTALLVSPMGGLLSRGRSKCPGSPPSAARSPRPGSDRRRDRRRGCGPDTPRRCFRSARCPAGGGAYCRGREAPGRGRTPPA